MLFICKKVFIVFISEGESSFISLQICEALKFSRPTEEEVEGGGSNKEGVFGGEEMGGRVKMGRESEWEVYSLLLVLFGKREILSFIFLTFCFATVEEEEDEDLKAAGEGGRVFEEGERGKEEEKEEERSNLSPNIRLIFKLI